MANQNQSYKGILEILENSSYSEIESFLTARFQQNLIFFQTDYPSLFESLQKPAQEYQLYVDEQLRKGDAA